MKDVYLHSAAGQNGHGIVCSVEELFFEGQKAKHLDLHRITKASSISAGSKRSRIHGRGMEFFESRPYVPFDEMRTIDWKVSARFSKLFTKVFIEERDRPIFFVVDLRPSMFFGSRRCFKSVLAAHLAAQLSIAAIHGGDQICGLTFDGERANLGGLGHTRHHLARWFGALAHATQALNSDEKRAFLDWPVVLTRLANRVRPGALVFLLSDFLDASDEMLPLLFRVRKRAQLFAFSIFDPLEEQIPALGRVGMSYGDERVQFDSNDKLLRRNYEHWWREHQEKVRRMFRTLAIPYLRFKTADDPDATLRMMLSGANRIG